MSSTHIYAASRRATGSLYTGEPRARLSRTSDSVGSSSWRTRTPKKKQCTRKPESRFPRKVTGNITHITCYFSHLQSYYLLLFTPLQATPLIHSAIFHCSEASIAVFSACEHARMESRRGKGRKKILPFPPPTFHTRMLTRGKYGLARLPRICAK